MNRYFLLVTLLATTLVAMPAYAAQYGCTGTVTYLSIDAGGNVTVGLSGGLPAGVRLCSVNSTTPNGFVPEACKATWAMLLADRISGQMVTIYFQDSLTCSTQPAFGNYSTAFFVTTAP